MIQTRTPNPNIPCKPGWCLAYVNEAFGVAKRYGSATAAWNASPTKHRDRNFPPGVWVPLWFSLANEPNGHVVLLAPDGAVYSTSHPTATTPTRHPDLADLFRAYSRYNPLTYLGWTEDVEGTPVLSAGITYQSTISATIQEDDMPVTDSFEPNVRASLQNITDQIGKLPGLDRDLRARLDVLAGFERDVRATFDVLRDQNAALTATVGTLAELLGQEQGLTADAIQSAVTEALKGARLTLDVPE